MDVFTPEEIRRLLDAQEEPLQTLLLTAVLTGMRQGELFGLQWEDIDFARHQVHVRWALWHGTLGTPKSRRSRRAIDMPPPLEQALPAALRRAELRRIRFHDLRHPYTSLLIAHGAHPKYIQAQLGHASIQTTLDRYGHLMPQLHQAEARKLSWCSGSRPLPRRARSRRCASDGRRGGAKWEQSPFPRDGVGAKWEQKRRRVSDLIANPSYCLVAGAGFAECYTAPDAYWLDLR
jgi:hypothetical protein